MLTVAPDKSKVYLNENSVSLFSHNETSILSIDFDNINLNDSNHDEDDPETFVHVRLLAWHIKFEKRKAFKKD